MSLRGANFLVGEPLMLMIFTPPLIGSLKLPGRLYLSCDQVFPLPPDMKEIASRLASLSPLAARMVWQEDHFVCH